MRSPLLFLLITLLIFGCSPILTDFISDKDYSNPNLKLGNPSHAKTDPANPDNFLLLKPQYALSFNRSRNIANWASWQLNESWMGKTKRQNNFRPDPDLPNGWIQVVTRDYSGSGFDRGHLVNSQDRTRSVEDNSATFLMTNIVPQAPDNNQEAWEKLETYSRDLAREGKELYIIAGGAGTTGEGSKGTAISLKNKVTVPATMWKVILVMDDPTKGLAGISSNTRTIAVIMPNRQGRDRGWQEFCASVEDVEKLTGYDFFSKVPRDIQKQIEVKKNC
jgi:endonuclease G, mitochondrial